MLIKMNVHGYSTNKKYVTGRGFVDSLSSIFNSIKSSALPALTQSLRGVGTYISNNKDQIFKPLLGAVGTLGAKALTEGLPVMINRIANRNRIVNRNKLLNAPVVDYADIKDEKYKEILANIMAPEQSIPVSNIIGSGIKKRRGSGLKKF
jgi:hypothetical protein